MKKILIFLMTIGLLYGCTNSRQETTFMITRDNELYALYNQDGDKLTEYLYKTFEEIEGLGYIITNEKDEKGFLSYEGQEVIQPGTYKTLENRDEMFYATTQQEVKQGNKEKKSIKTTTYVLNKSGQVLYQTGNQLQIIKSGLPIIKENNEYIVLYHNGEEAYRGEDVIRYAHSYNNSELVVLGKQEQSVLYRYFNDGKTKPVEIEMKDKGTFSILGALDTGAILSDTKSKKMVYVDYANYAATSYDVLVESVEIDALNQIYLKNANQTYAYTIGKEPVLMTSYYFSPQTYLKRSQVIYGPHDIYKDNQKVGDIENVQLYPAAMKISSELFPVYVRDKGYKYYNFDNKCVIDKVYLSAQPFDDNLRAIVEVKENEYSLIDENGKQISEKTYAQIKYLGSTYYAVYDESGMYGIVDKNGKVIFDIEYTTLSNEPIVKYDNRSYLLLGKNGRTYIYDIDDDMSEIFSKEGYVVMSEKGYFMVDNTYYTFDGELIK